MVVFRCLKLTAFNGWLVIAIFIIIMNDMLFLCMYSQQ